MKREVLPEILDSLPENDPEAISNRKDLHRINILMGNYRWIVNQIVRHRKNCERILELGAGTGELGKFLYQENPRLSEYTGLDLISKPSSWPSEWLWWKGDIMDFREWEHYQVCVVNLFLHHLDDCELRKLGEKLKGFRVIIAGELIRRPIFQKLLKLTRIWGAGQVTLHDGHVSIQAGFIEKELPQLLGLDENLWQVVIKQSLLGSYRMLAVKKEMLTSSGLSK
ncbi:MAG: class I SAM-dependent methyltransferase [Verrucomicrobiota bacterium]